MASNQLFDITVSDTVLSFFEDGTVTSAGQPAAGTWNTSSSDRKNGISYAFAGAQSNHIPVDYTINDHNQLVLSVPEDGEIEAAGPFPLQGGFVLEENRNITYYLVKDDGWWVQTEVAFYVYGDISLDVGETELTINGDGADIALKAEEGATPSIVAAQGEEGSDLLQFVATTKNPLGGGALVEKRAKLKFQGAWDVMKDGLVFVTHYTKTDSGKPTFYLGVSGKLKGVAGGFELYSEGGSPKLLLKLYGKISGTNKKGEWNLSLGYSNRTFTADLSLSENIVNQGSSLTFKGRLRITSGPGADHQFDLELETTYQSQHGQFKILVNGGAGRYSLEISGLLKISDWDASFSIVYSSTGNKSITIKLGLAKPGTSLHADLQLVLAPGQKKLTANLSLKLTFVAGQLAP